MILCKLRLITAALFVGWTLVQCRTAAPSGGASGSLAASAPRTGLAFYEQTRIRTLQAEKSCKAFKAQEGLVVTKRAADGKAAAGTLRVLADNADEDIWVVGDFNQWGAAKTPSDHLHPVPGTPYFEGQVRALAHGMQYRLVVNGTQVLDPAAPVYTAAPGKLNSVFWDFGRPGAYKMATKSVDLRSKPLVIAEGEVYELARKWHFQGQDGPAKASATYSFVATSGLVAELRGAGYNAVEFLPFNASLDDELWPSRYQAYGPFAPDARYGTPDDFARMIDAFNKAGLAVIMDAVVDRYPFQGNESGRELAGVGLHQWKRADGQALFGDAPSPEGSRRYDYANPYVRRFLVDSVMHMLCQYGISGVRFDDKGGSRLEGEEGRSEFLKELTSEIRAYRPEAMLVGEIASADPEALQRLDQGGTGLGFRSHSGLFGFFRDNMQKSTQDVDMARLGKVIRDPWDKHEAAHVQYVTNHEGAASKGGGAYVATLLNGRGWYYVEKKTMAFASAALLSGAAYMDMPQLRLLQEGNFDDNTAVEWSLKKRDSQRNVYNYLAALSKLVRDQSAFAFLNYDEQIENHIDTVDGRRIISLQRRDPATGELFFAVVNLSHVGLTNYRFGVNASGSFRVLIDDDAQIFGGSGELEKRLPGGVATADGPALHGKTASLLLPYLPPYGAIVLQKQ